MELVQLASSLDALVLAELDKAGVVDGLRTTTRLRRLLDACDIQLNRRLVELAADDPAISPEHTNAEATQRCLRKGRDAVSRAKRATGVPFFEDAVANGSISAEHLDAFVHAVNRLKKVLQPQLLELQPLFVHLATRLTVEDFVRRLNDEVRRIEGDDGQGRLQQQKRRNRAKTWTDAEGMWNLHAAFDPETALPLAEALQRMTERLFHGEHPEDLPEDPVARHQWFQAAALAMLMHGHGTGGDPVILATVDEKTLRTGERHERSRVNVSHGLDLPIDALLTFSRCRFLPVVLDEHGNVVRVGTPVTSLDDLLTRGLERTVRLNHGRDRRHGQKAQGVAMRAMYRTCAIPGCSTPVGKCEMHHLVFWEHGGLTDIANLLPICPHHHDQLHAEGWELTMRPDRSLVIRKQGVIVMSTGPPATQWA
jgi:hypothetical protein